MRRCGSAKQCIRLGPSRYLCCSGRRYTDAHAYCYCHGYCHGYCQPYCHSIGNGHAATDANTQGGAIGKTASNAFPAAVEIASWQILLNGQLFVSCSIRTAAIRMPLWIPSGDVAVASTSLRVKSDS